MKSLVEIDDFVAVDSSTTSIAFAYVHDDHIQQYGKMIFNGSNIYEKLIDIAHKTQGLFGQLPVDTLVIESSFYSKNPRTATNLALAQGAIIGSAAMAGVLRVGSVMPIVWQRGIDNKPLSRREKAEVAKDHPGKSISWTTNYIRKLRKQRTIDYVNAKYNLNVNDDDIADALGIAAYVANNRTKVNWS